MLRYSEASAVTPQAEPDPAKRDRKSFEANAGQLGGDILRHRPLDFANEPQGQVKLVVDLPAKAVQPAHQAQQCLSNDSGRPNSDEQPVHAQAFAQMNEGRLVRFRLKASKEFPILRPGARAHSPSDRRDNAEPI